MARNPSSAGRYGAPRPENEQFSDEDWPEHDHPAPPWPGAPQAYPGGTGGGGPRKQRMHPLTIAAIAVLAAAAGAILVLVLAKGPSSSPAASTQPGSAPSVVAPPNPGTGGNGGGFPGGGGGAGGPGQIFMAGRVLAVSSSSITIGGPSHTIKAEISSSTKFNGQAHSLGAIKVGDIVTAQINNTGSQPVATAIQDPAQIP